MLLDRWSSESVLEICRSRFAIPYRTNEPRPDNDFRLQIPSVICVSPANASVSLIATNIMVTLAGNRFKG